MRFGCLRVFEVSVNECSGILPSFGLLACGEMLAVSRRQLVGILLDGDDGFLPSSGTVCLAGHSAGL